MTVHQQSDQFLHAKGKLVEQGTALNPLANPYILKVVPFWLGGQVCRNDLTDPEPLFDPECRLVIESVLHLDDADIEARHGEAVRKKLEGRTGLYVVVDDLKPIHEGVRGQILGLGQSRSSICELIVETAAGLIIFAQDMARHCRAIH